MGLQARLAHAQYKLAGRAYWHVRYTTGREIREYEGVEWFDLPRAGLCEVRLVCPNGQVAVLGAHSVPGARGHLGDMAFQLKVAIMGLGGPRTTLAQLVGLQYGEDGACVLYAWEYGPRRLVGPLQDNVTALRYQQLGALGPATLVGAAHS